MADLSTIGRGTTIRGNVRADGDLDVHGRVEGAIVVKGELSIAETALIKSDVSGRRVIVRGAIAGNVSADESLILEPGARVVGDLSAPRIGIRPGALLRGHVSTDGSTPPARPEPARAAPPRAQPAPVRAAAAPLKPKAAPAAPSRATVPAPAPAPAAVKPAPSAKATRAQGGPPPPVVPSLARGAKATLKRKGGR